jgi:hypothetical protein
MALYNPPTKVTTCEQPYLALVSKADPDFQRYKYREVEYNFQRRSFIFNPYTSGAYSRLSNTYPVGAQQGGPDPLIAAALAPTVGNVVPGLYEGVATGAWA